MADETPDAAGGERIARRLARAGVCSRRDAERMIAEGRVAVNGVVIGHPAPLVVDGDVLTVDGAAVASAEPTRLWRYHKPSGLVSTARDDKGRPTVFDHLPPGMPRVISVGRLDLTSEGLLLLTNDGELARHLELPANGWLRRYRVRAHGSVEPAALARLAQGVTIDGVVYEPIEAAIDRVQGSNLWLTMGLREGRNREIRRVLGYLGLTVNRLIRVAFGPFQLGRLAVGAVEEIPRRVLRDQLGTGFAVGASRDRRAPVAPPPAALPASPSVPRFAPPSAPSSAPPSGVGAAQPRTGPPVAPVDRVRQRPPARRLSSGASPGRGASGRPGPLGQGPLGQGPAGPERMGPGPARRGPGRRSIRSG